MSRAKILASIKGWNPNDWCLAYILFFSILYEPLVPLGFFAWLIVLWRNIERKSYPFWSGTEFWFVLYYIGLGVGLLWTQDIDNGLFKLENKLSFLVFPLLFYFSRFSISKKSVLNILLLSICLSLVMYECIAVFKSIYHPEDNQWGYFKDSLFSLFMHRGYYAFYLVIGSLICHEHLQKNTNRLRYGLLFVFLVIGVIQTYSKAGTLSLVAFNMFLFLNYVIRKKKWKIAVSVGAGIIAFIFIFNTTDSTLKNRFKKIPTSTDQIQLKNNNSAESNQARILMWSASLKSIQKGQFHGYGTGDDITILKEQNQADHNLKMAEEGMNSHNQFLTSTLQIGIPGLFILFMFFWSACRKAFKDKDLLTILISLCFFSNFLIESFLERQAGVVLFCVLTLCLTLKRRTS